MLLTQPDNPTPNERYQLLLSALTELGRPEDFQNIIELFSPPQDITKINPAGSCKHIKVGILGGGLAGLSAAFELRKLGFDITIFEAEEERIGGRVYTHFFDEFKSLYGELGPMRIPVSHETVWHYMDLLRLKTRPFVQFQPNAFIFVRDVRLRQDDGGESVQQKIYPFFDMTPEERATLWPEFFELIFDETLQEMPPEIRRELLEVLPIYSPEILALDTLNFRELMQAKGLSEGAIEMLSNIQPFVEAFLYLNFLDELGPEYAASYFYMYEILDGMVQLPLALHQAILSPLPPYGYDDIPAHLLGNVHWKSGHYITGLSQSIPGGSVQVDYLNKKKKCKGEDTFDFVICTLPFSSLQRVELNPIFKSRKMQAISEVNYASAQKTIMLCRHRFWETGDMSERILGGGSVTDLPIATIWYPSDHAYPINLEENLWGFRPGTSPYEPGVLLASYNWTQEAIRVGNTPGPTRFEDIKRQVEKVHGLPEGYLDSIVLDYKTVHWNREPLFLGAFAFYEPQQKSLFNFVSAEPDYHGRVHFAGEHVSAIRQWMQGSLKTGMEAANAVAKICSHYVS
ncbi:amine oxidase [Alkaliphilus metalliredigens QYMF]|uniref:Amine oxidase n=1 Tax=Alkaliphilus metalliredigens (strain QYMF) TaxID=293826 RepID=A6TSA3_ALKMQ|nr:NAD(P)/FAD-dependent oxidoreductase [Alkaliphilus metalliredigens]ABR49071.1 amine oxidase [Alkaliphilus metalliredigens QYMF]